MRKFTSHSRPVFCNPFPLTSPFPRKRSPLSSLDTLPSFRLWMISSMLSASKPPRKHTHYENKILVWGPITELREAGKLYAEQSSGKIGTPERPRSDFIALRRDSQSSDPRTIGPARSG